MDEAVTTTTGAPTSVSSELAMRRTGMAFQRTRMAADRTLMAVIRTALSLISAGKRPKQYPDPEFRRCPTTYLCAFPGGSRRRNCVLTSAWTRPMYKTEPVVFLLDDDSSFVNQLSSLLQARGFTTRAFTAIDEFLQGHDDDCPGCLVLDIGMPGVTGLDLRDMLAARAPNARSSFLRPTPKLPCRSGP